MKKKDLQVSFVDTTIDHFKVLKKRSELICEIADCRKKNLPLCNMDISKVDLTGLDFRNLTISNVVFNRCDIDKVEIDYSICDCIITSGIKRIYNYAKEGLQHIVCGFFCCIMTMLSCVFKNRSCCMYHICRKGPSAKPIIDVDFRGASISNVCFANCKFVRCNFDSVTAAIDSHIVVTNKTLIRLADFFLCEFIQCRFRKATITIADFRYTQLTDCSLGEIEVNYGDFYMAAFKGSTSFDGCILKECSLTNTVFEHECVRFESIHKLIQENYSYYIDIFYNSEFKIVDSDIECKWYRRNQCGAIIEKKEYEIDSSGLQSKSLIRLEASKVYAQLSGIYASKGFFKDSNKAYRIARYNKFLHYWFSLLSDQKKDLCCILRHIRELLGYVIAWTLGFGYQLKKVFVLFLLIVGGFACYLRNCNSSWFDAIVKSLCYSVGIGDNCDLAGGEQIAFCLETVCGILLIGYAGFIIANRMRNNY
ncbi:MAG: hypothetical protein K2K25_02050 [Muribaculaceae bacterium]|nr:hypothetical protein [Muribaculaceae bacterium]